MAIFMDNIDWNSKTSLECHLNLQRFMLRHILNSSCYDDDTRDQETQEHVVNIHRIEMRLNELQFIIATQKKYKPIINKPIENQQLNLFE